MFCARCGVELSEGQTVCPICNLRVYHPDLKIQEKSTYPKGAFISEEFNRKGLLFVITMFCLIPLLTPIILELAWHGTITWAGLVAGGTVLFYIVCILPLWFKRPNPVIFVPCFFLTASAYLFYICFLSGGNWFLTFALPLTMSLTAIATAQTALLYYLKRGRLYVVGGGLIALGIWTVLLEILIKVNFGSKSAFSWSSAPLTILTILGLSLIIIAIVKPLKETLRRIFFIGKVK